jgi:hypothetical protein
MNSVRLIILFYCLLATTLAQEVAPLEIPLTGPAANTEREMSGLAWYHETLILLPQNVSPTEPAFYRISKAALLQWLEHPSENPLEPQPVTVSLPDYEREIPGYEGLEAICFNGDTVYLALEAKNEGKMLGYLVNGTIDPTAWTVTINPNSRVTLKPPVNIKNMAYEALLVYNHSLVAFYEANGRTVNPKPKAVRYATTLKPLASIQFPTIEYRITDVTTMDDQGIFWAINYYWPGEAKYLQPAEDLLVKRFGRGTTHQQTEHVERLVQFQFTPAGITLTSTSPIQIALDLQEPRNWEGLVRLDDRGFLIITDEYPRTILAFVPYPTHSAE